MSLWSCPTHGLVGPMACCDRASWAYVGDPSTEPVATLTTTPDPEWDAAIREYQTALQRRIVEAYLDWRYNDPLHELAAFERQRLAAWPGIPSLRVTDLNVKKDATP